MRKRYQIPLLEKQSNVIIGLGDSFTQGVGGWSPATYEKYKNKIEYSKINENEFKEMYNNSWVSQLVTNHLSDFISINLGKLGVGNRAASSELHLNPDINIKNISGGYVIFMLSGLERFDFVNKDFQGSHFFAVWPQKPHEGIVTPNTWKAYEAEVWSEEFSLIESIISIKNVEVFAKAHGMKLILISAFDQRYNKHYFNKKLGKELLKLVDSVPWDRFVYPRNMASCINVLVDLEGKPQDLAYGEFWPYYNSLKEPSRYISNCAHPTVEGYRIIAEEIYNFIKKDRL